MRIERDSPARMGKITITTYKNKTQQNQSLPHYNRQLDTQKILVNTSQIFINTFSSWINNLEYDKVFNYLTRYEPYEVPSSTPIIKQLFYIATKEKDTIDLEPLDNVFPGRIILMALALAMKGRNKNFLKNFITAIPKNDFYQRLYYHSLLEVNRIKAEKIIQQAGHLACFESLDHLLDNFYTAIEDEDKEESIEFILNLMQSTCAPYLKSIDPFAQSLGNFLQNSRDPIPLDFNEKTSLRNQLAIFIKIAKRKNLTIPLKSLASILSNSEESFPDSDLTEKDIRYLNKLINFYPINKQKELTNLTIETFFKESK